MSTFNAGDHIRVKRRLPTHHGIYVSDCRVIDFSGGRHIFEKPKALVQARTLKEFEGKRGRAKKVEYPGKFLGGLGFWPGPEWTYPPADVVKRAEALCQVAATQGAYRLSGSNCEHIATWCMCGAHESKQVRYVHGGHAVLGFGLLGGWCEARAWRALHTSHLGKQHRSGRGRACRLGAVSLTALASSAASF